MAKLDWVILCERAVIEAVANNVSIVSIVENIGIPAPPPELKGKAIAVPFRFFVVQQWSRRNRNAAERVNGRIAFKGPDGKQQSTMEFLVDLSKTPRARVITQALGFQFVDFGIYQCLVQAKRGGGWRTLGGTEFQVSEAPPIAIVPTKH